MENSDKNLAEAIKGLINLRKKINNMEVVVKLEKEIVSREPNIEDAKKVIFDLADQELKEESEVSNYKIEIEE
jgi:hypothetical protein